MDASAFFAEGGSCFATTVKMYDAASAGVRLANTGPDCRSSDCTATLPRSASAAVSGCQPELTEVAAAPVAVGVTAAGRSTRAYQYHTATRSMRMTRQPALFRQPFMVGEREGWARIPRRAESGKGGQAQPESATRYRDPHAQTFRPLHHRASSRGP